MKSDHSHHLSNDLQEESRPMAKTVRRALHRPRKAAPEPETLRGWARSSIKSRNKS